MTEYATYTDELGREVTPAISAMELGLGCVYLEGHSPNPDLGWFCMEIDYSPFYTDGVTPPRTTVTPPADPECDMWLVVEACRMLHDELGFAHDTIAAALLDYTVTIPPGGTES
jgi:hypothetical protein